MRAKRLPKVQPFTLPFLLICISFLFWLGTPFAGNAQPPAGSEVSAPAAEKIPEAEQKEKPPPPQGEERVITELRMVPFQKIRQPDDTLQKGVVKVVQQGRHGRERVTFRIREINGVEVERTVLGREVLSSPRPHIERVGTAPRIVQRTVTEVVPIPFQKEQKSDESLPAGIIKVIQAGREGQEKITYRITITDGKETDRVVVASELISPPLNQIEVAGTGKPSQETPSSPLPPPVDTK